MWPLQTVTFHWGQNSPQKIFCLRRQNRHTNGLVGYRQARLKKSVLGLPMVNGGWMLQGISNHRLKKSSTVPSIMLILKIPWIRILILKYFHQNTATSLCKNKRFIMCALRFHISKTFGEVYRSLNAVVTSLCKSCTVIFCIQFKSFVKRNVLDHWDVHFLAFAAELTLTWNVCNKNALR